MVRTKTTELSVLDDRRFHLVARLTDVSYDCDWGPAGPDGVVHDFVVEGELEGDDLVVTALTVEAAAHPYRSCPAVVSSCAALVGQPLASGWRRAVLDTLGGTAGCTHVTTLLLGLAEVRTSAFFLRMNERAPYTPATRADGRWTAAGLSLAPSIVGACHVLTREGPVVAQAEQARAGAPGDGAPGDRVRRDGTPDDDRHPGAGAPADQPAPGRSARRPAAATPRAARPMTHS